MLSSYTWTHDLILLPKNPKHPNSTTIFSILYSCIIVMMMMASLAVSVWKPSAPSLFSALHGWRNLFHRASLTNLLTAYNDPRSCPLVRPHADMLSYNTGKPSISGYFLHLSSHSMWVYSIVCHTRYVCWGLKSLSQKIVRCTKVYIFKEKQ